METQDLPNEVIKIVVPQMFSENTGKQLNEIRKTTQEQNEKFNKEQTKKEPNKFGTEEYIDCLIELDYLLKNSVEILTEDSTKQRKLEDRAFEIIQSEELKEKKEWKKKPTEFMRCH